MTSKETVLVDIFFDLPPLQRWRRRSETSTHWHVDVKRPKYVNSDEGKSNALRRERNIWVFIYFPSGRTSWTECVIEILGVLTVGNTAPSKHALYELKDVVNSWAVFTLLITTAYLSGLLSHLTCLAFSKPLDSIHALVDADVYWSHKYYPAMVHLFDFQVGLPSTYLL